MIRFVMLHGISGILILSVAIFILLIGGILIFSLSNPKKATATTGLEKMKRAIQILTSGVLLFVALFAVIALPLSMLLWILGIARVHEEFWSALLNICAILSGCIAIGFVILDFLNRTSARSRKVRLFSASLVCILLLVPAVHKEVKQIKGWSSEEAALSVASSIYPNLKDSFILRIDEVQDIPAWTRGPNISYTVLVEDEPVCRVEVCRRYWSYWISGGHQRLKDRKPNL